MAEEMTIPLVYVVLSEGQDLTQDQIRALDKRFTSDYRGWEIYRLDPNALSEQEQMEQIINLFVGDLVFVPPITHLLAYKYSAERRHFLTYLLHNDTPGADSGWKVVN